MTGPLFFTERLAAENVEKVLADGPRLRSDYNVWVEAVDPRGFVLLGGLGAMGVGVMWVDDSVRYRDYPGYSEAATAERLCEKYPPMPTGLRSCSKPYGHSGPHHVPPVAAIKWSDHDDPDDPSGSGVGE